MVVIMRSAAAGVDGLMIEAHIGPRKAWSAGRETVTIDAMAEIMRPCTPTA